MKEHSLNSEKIAKNSVALAGEFTVLSQLALHGYDASMTLGNTKNIDILVFNPEKKKASQIEVKTNLQKRNGPTDSKIHGKFETSWQMDEKHERIIDSNLFYCFVHINRSRRDGKEHKFRFFIVPSRVVAKYVREEHQAWLRASRKHRTSARRNFRIGCRNDRHISVPAPRFEKYENKWNLLLPK
jgi:hypothetical protein